jgi:hypothetical protein
MRAIPADHRVGYFHSISAFCAGKPGNGVIVPAPKDNLIFIGGIPLRAREKKYFDLSELKRTYPNLSELIRTYPN